MGHVTSVNVNFKYLNGVDTEEEDPRLVSNIFFS